MRFALLGDHPEALRVARSLAQLPEHRLQAAAEIGQQAASDLIAAVPGVRLVNDWEELLAGDACEAVIIGGTTEAVLNGARQLASNGKTLLLMPIAAQGSAFIYELTLIHDDNRVPLVPVVPLVAQKLVERMRTAIAAGAIGRVVLLRLERGLNSDREAGLMSRELLNAEMLHDALLLRSLGVHCVSPAETAVQPQRVEEKAQSRQRSRESYSRITAVHSGTTSAGVSMATVTLGGEGLPEATWIARAAEPHWNLIVTGTDGEATLTLDRTSLGGQLVIKPKATEPQTFADDGASAGARTIEATLQRLAHSTDCWIEMTRAFETVEATATSLRRRRTIDMQFETTSERSIFKSQMAAGGCSLLLLTLVGLVAFLLLGAFLDSRSMVQRSAEAAGRVVATTEFDVQSSELNRVGQQHMLELARRLERSPEPIFVMPESSGETSELDRQRIAVVVRELKTRGLQHADVLVDHAKLPSAVAQFTLKVLRFAWIAPLMIFLCLQVLLFVARPSSSEDDEPRS